MFIMADSGKERTVRSPGHSTKILTNLADMRKSDTLCDITLIAEERHFKAHKVVLASASEYFEVMFSSGMRESKETEIKMGNIPAEILSILLDFIYTGQLTFHLDTIDELLHASTMLLFMDIRRECLSFLQQKLNISNCVKVKHLAEVYDDKELAHKVSQFILEHFEEIVESETDDLHNLTTEEFIELICSDDIFCKTEDVVVKCLLKWLVRNNQLEETFDVSSIFDKLIANVRLPFISQKAIDDSIMVTLKEKFPVHHKKMLALLDEAKKRQLTVTRRKQIMPRTSYKCLPMLFCVAKQGDTLCFDHKGKKFTKLARFPAGYQPESLVSDSGCGTVYAVASTSSVDSNGIHVTSRTLFQFDLHNSSDWKQTSNDKLAIQSFSATVFQGKLYIVGGKMTRNPHVDEEIEVSKMLRVYDPKEGKWKIKSPTQDERVDSTLVAADECIFVIGGLDTADSSFPIFNWAVNTVEMYYPEADSWELLPPMKYSRLKACGVFYNSKLFLFGGFHGEATVKPVEIYNQQRKEWSSVYSLPVNVKNIKSSVVLDDKILVFGELAFAWTSGRECTIDFSPKERSKKLKSAVSSLFFHSSHFSGYLLYEVAEIPVYSHKKAQEWYCNCGFFESDDEDWGMQESIYSDSGRSIIYSDSDNGSF